MASATVMEKLKEIATCTMCSGLMEHPVSIHCGHSYCLLCICAVVKETPWCKRFQCPHCGSSFEEGSWVYNNHVERLVELIQEMEKTERELLCETHGERLQLFCEDDGQLICWRCERGPQHQGHPTALVEDMYQGYKEKLEKAARNLSSLQEECVNQKVFITTQITKWKDKTEIWRQKIKSDFKNLHTFLQEEEKLHLWKLEKEEEQMLRRLRESEANLQKKSNELKSQILEMEAKCQGSAQNLLQDVEGTLSRTHAVKLELPEVFPL